MQPETEKENWESIELFLSYGNKLVHPMILAFTCMHSKQTKL